MKRTGLVWGGLIGIILVLLRVAGATTPLDNIAYDLSAVARAGGTDEPRIALIAIDQDSLDKLGVFPWSRETHARLIDRLAAAGASAILFDVSFTDPTGADEVLADAMQRAGNVYLPVLLNTRRTAPVVTYDEPASALRGAAAGLGHITLPLGSDGVVRRVAVEHAAGENGYLAIGLLGALRGLNSPTAAVEPRQPGRYDIGPLTIPVDTALETPIEFAGPPGSFRTYSYFSVLQGEVPPTELAGRIVLVGATAAGLADEHATPFSRQGAPTMTGLEIQANITAMALHRQFLHEIASPLLAVLLVAGLALWGMVIAGQSSSTRLVVTVSALAVTVLMWMVGWSLLRVYVAPNSLWFGIGALYVGLAYWDIRSVNRLSRRQLRQIEAVITQPEAETSLERRIVSGAERLLDPAGVLLYVGKDASLTGTAGVTGTPPAVLPHAVRTTRTWTPRDGLADWLAAQAIVHAAAYPLGDDLAAPAGWLVLFFSRDYPSLNRAAESAQLLPATARLIEAFVAQVSPLLRPEAVNRSRDVAAQVSTLVQLEHHLLSQHSILTATSQHIADGVVACDLTGTIYFFNRTMESIVPVRRWLGGSMADLLEDLGLFPPGEGTAQLRGLYGRTREAQGEITQEAQVWRATLRRIDDTDSRPVGIVAVFTNITDLRLLDRTREDMISFLAHEFRTPLTAMVGASGLLSEELEERNPIVTTALDILERGASQMGRLIDDLLQVTRLEAGRLSLHVQHVGAVQAIQESVQLVQEAAADKNITIAVEAPDHLSVQADLNRLVQVVTNLLSNAIKYSPVGSTVTVRACDQESYVTFSVLDHGAGIPEAERSKLFTKFFRGSNVVGSTAGTGLGLVIVKHLVEAQGGEIRVESREGAGSCFSFTLPVSSLAPVFGGSP